LKTFRKIHLQNTEIIQMATIVRQRLRFADNALRIIVSLNKITISRL